MAFDGNNKTDVDNGDDLFSAAFDHETHEYEDIHVDGIDDKEYSSEVVAFRRSVIED